MSWALVLVLAAGAYLQKVAGLVLVGGRRLPAVVERCLALVPAALIAALIITATFSEGRHLHVDERAAGVAAAVVAAWRKAPLVVVIAAGAAVTAALRAMT